MDQLRLAKLTVDEIETLLWLVREELPEGPFRARLEEKLTTADRVGNLTAAPPA